MNHIHFGLFCEGPTDRAALPPFIDKVMLHLRATEANASNFEWSVDIDAGKSSNENLAKAIENNYYDIILVHRDGSNNPQQMRDGILEIANASVPIIPVYEVEAWLIVDFDAFRKATNTSVQKILPQAPSLNQIETINDPKEIAKIIFKECLGYLPSSRQFGDENWYGLVAEEVRFARVRQLHWFDTFIFDLRNGLLELGWPFPN